MCGSLVREDNNKQIRRGYSEEYNNKSRVWIDLI